MDRDTADSKEKKKKKNLPTDTTGRDAHKMRQGLSSQLTSPATDLLSVA